MAFQEMTWIFRIILPNGQLAAKGRSRMKQIEVGFPLLVITRPCHCFLAFRSLRFEASASFSQENRVAIALKRILFDWAFLLCVNEFLPRRSTPIKLMLPPPGSLMSSSVARRVLIASASLPWFKLPNYKEICSVTYRNRTAPANPTQL